MRKITILAAILILMGSLTGVALAVPTLQLDIIDGYYVGGGDDTTYNTTNPFTLRALYGGDVNNYSAILSVAVVPGIAPSSPDLNLGYFTYVYGGVTNTVAVTGNMVYGTPPIAPITTGGGGDLPSHGVFDTYFMEIPFSFDLSQFVPSYNTQTGESANGTLAFQDFVIDYAGLNEGYALHFDLYHLDSDNWIREFAPFSHDAQTNSVVPEPGTMMLLGSGLVGLAGWGRKKFRK